MSEQQLIEESFKDENPKKQLFSSVFIQKGGQDALLTHLTENKIAVSVFLLSGIKLDGFIIGHDAYSIRFQDNSASTMLIYKDKIATIRMQRHG